MNTIPPLVQIGIFLFASGAAILCVAVAVDFAIDWLPKIKALKKK